MSMQKVYFQGRIHDSAVLCFKAFFKITVEKEHERNDYLMHTLPINISNKAYRLRYIEL
jgi:hypothetical protein